MLNIENLVAKLVNAGADVEKVKEALGKSNTGKGTPIEEVVADLPNITDLQYLEAKLKSARGGKSKAKSYKNAAEAIKEYESHIEAMKARKEQLMKEIDGQPTWDDKVAKAKEFNLAPATLLDRYVMKGLEEQSEKVLEVLASQNNLSKAQIRAILNSIPVAINEKLEEILNEHGVYEDFNDRIESGDHRAVALARKCALVLQ